MKDRQFDWGRIHVVEPEVPPVKPVRPGRHKYVTQVCHPQNPTYIIKGTQVEITPGTQNFLKIEESSLNSRRQKAGISSIQRTQKY